MRRTVLLLALLGLACSGGTEEKKSDTITTDSGLQITDLQVGTGPSPKATDRVKVHYTGMLENGVTFDSSVARGEPAVFPSTLRLMPAQTYISSAKRSTPWLWKLKHVRFPV